MQIDDEADGLLLPERDPDEGSGSDPVTKMRRNPVAERSVQGTVHRHLDVTVIFVHHPRVRNPRHCRRSAFSDIEKNRHQYTVSPSMLEQST